MTETISGPDGLLRVTEGERGKREISLEPADPSAAHGGDHWVTEYPVGLIEEVFRVKGLWVCDEIRRDEDPSYVERSLKYSLLGYLEDESLAGKRLLDLGCGCGSSSLNLARMLDGVEIVGVELVGDFVDLARKRAEFHGIQNVAFHHSPDGQSLPDGLGGFELIVLSAVHEHLLPEERRALLPMLWDRLRPAGVLFINQLPHRYSPFENHTTGLPFINYLPDRVAHRVALSLSRRVAKDESWEDLLRRGIRGGTASEITGILSTATGEEPTLMEPSQFGMRDRIDLWYALSSASRWPAIKRSIKATLKTLKALTGVTFVPELSLAIRKTASSTSGQPKARVAAGPQHW